MPFPFSLRLPVQEALHREGAYTVAVCPHDGFFKLPEDAVKERVLLRKGQAPDPAVLRRLVPGCGPGGSVTVRWVAQSRHLPLPPRSEAPPPARLRPQLCGTTSPFLEAAAATGAPAIALAPHPLGARDVPRGWEGVIPSVAAPKAKKRGDEGGSGGGLLSSLARALNKDEDADAEEGASSAAGAGQAPLLAVRSLHEAMDALDGMDEQRQ